jgi:sulfide dehydrogenase [flavocytochrome c] flavoprotein chain
MKSPTRREFGCLTGAMVLAGLGPRLASSEVRARVVVVGGGIGGATAAKYLAANARTIEVTLVEPKPNYTTCFFSNLYLAGLCSLESLTHGYTTLAQRNGINVIRDSVTAIDPVAKTVGLKSGPKLPYDRVVVAPGIAFNYGAIAGYDEAATQDIPHAWNAGPQTQLLRRQLESMEDGGVFVLPARPIRTCLSGCLLFQNT